MERHGRKNNAERMVERFSRLETLSRVCFAANRSVRNSASVTRRVMRCNDFSVSALQLTAF